MRQFGRVILDLGSENTTSFKSRCQCPNADDFERNKKTGMSELGGFPWSRDIIRDVNDADSREAGVFCAIWICIKEVIYH